MMRLEADGSKRNLVLHFQVHQPRRFNQLNFLDINAPHHYFNDALNKTIVQRVANVCYLPVNTLLLRLIQQHPDIKVAFSISGIALDQFEEYAPEVIASFKALAETENVEFLSGTYYHSLASVTASEEFEIQVLEHAEKLQEHFGVRPGVFRNTALIYSDAIGKRIANMGFQGVITEGHEQHLGQISPHYLYQHPDNDQLKIMLRNYRLSDDIAFRFNINGVKLNTTDYISWLNAMPVEERLINIAMDYETFGEHHKQHEGILDFLEELLITLSMERTYQMVTPSEALEIVPVYSTLSFPRFVSWADDQRDLSPWLGNDMQKDAFGAMMKLEEEVKRTQNCSLIKQWRYLQSSDHFLYMSGSADQRPGTYHYFSPFPTAYEAFINFMNIVTHFTLQVHEAKSNASITDKDLSNVEAERRSIAAPLWARNIDSSEGVKH